MSESSTLEPVQPARPVAGYIGGKRNLSKRLVAMIQSTPHLTYAEPFVGMGGVFLRRTLRPRAEVINDWSADVATLFRILQRHYAPFVEMLRYQLHSRADFERLMKLDPEALTDLERAARFLCLQRMAFGGKVAGRNFGVSYHQSARLDLTKLEPMLAELHDRLAGVVIERLHFDRFMERYDSLETLFFIDPPYWDCESDYGEGLFSKADFELLAARLKALRGRFILTINDVPQTRVLFADWPVEPVRLTYGVSGAPTEGRELIVVGGIDDAG